MITDYYNDVKSDYLEFFNNKNSLKQKKDAARNVIQHIVNSFFSDYEIVKDYNHYFDTKQFSAKYKDRYGYRFPFLIEKKRIKRKYKSAFEYIWHEASDFGTAHKKYGEGLNNLNQFHGFLNQILTWFLDENGKDKSYLISEQNIGSEYEMDNEIFNKKIQEEKKKREEIQRELQKIKVANKENEKKKKKLTLVLVLFTTPLFFLGWYAFSLNKEIDIQEKDIQTRIADHRILEEKTKFQQYKIDSLKNIVSLRDTERKDNYIKPTKSVVNHGINNEFNGKVGTVSNYNQVDTLKL